jgi:hypothetical protein
MALIQVKRRGPTLANAAAATERALKDLALSERIRPGRRVAITAGSRGIAEIATITKTLIAALRHLKAERIIDLSQDAARRLGVYRKGTALVRVETIPVDGV